MVATSEKVALVAHIILDSPLPQLDHPFDYSVPERLHAEVRVGQKVLVPLRAGQRRTEGWIIGLSDTTDFAGNLAEIDSIVSPVVALTPELYALARTVADRQAGSAVDVLRLAIPQRYVRAEKEYLTSHVEIREAERAASESHDSLTATQSDAGGERVSMLVSGPVVKNVDGSTTLRWAAQFAELAKSQCEIGKSVIMTVPDFRDLEILNQALISSGLSDCIVRTDASLPGAQRWTNYLRILHEDCLVVIGNRSSVYAPVKNLGLIAMWDAADESLTEPLAPYAHPRDVALIRQADTGCSLVFAAHAISVESARLEKIGYIETRNIGEESVPITATDLHSQREEGERSSRIPPSALVAARAAIKRGPVLVQVARPGYASTTRCANCRERAHCTTCNGPLALRSKATTPSCRWCGHLEPAWSCSSCHSSTLTAGQPGSEKTAEDLARAFPGVKVIFSDAEKRLTPISAEPALVIATVGTEPLAIGGYRCIILLDGESARIREDLETDVTALRSWMNAAALAAEGASVFVSGTGEVLGKVLEAGDFPGFASRSLAERESLGLPPATRVAVVTGSREAINTVESALADMPHRSILGPVPFADESYRIIVAFDYKDGAAVAKTLRALILKTAITSRKPPTASGGRARVLRLNVRIDDFALRGIG